MLCDCGTNAFRIVLTLIIWSRFLTYAAPTINPGYGPEFYSRVYAASQSKKPKFLKTLSNIQNIL